MSYIDCYLIPVPRANKAAYEQLARISSAVLREHGALLLWAPRMHFPDAFTVVGWGLVGTTFALTLIPWRYHQRFASWSVPQATRQMPLLGLGSILAGVVLLGALLLPRAQS